MNRSFWMALVALIFVMGCGSNPVQPGESGIGGSGPFGLLDGPYASVDEVPVAESPAFLPTPPKRMVLTNGLNVLLQVDPALPIAEVRIYVDAGTYDDPRGRTGVAEVAARVMREGGGETWPAELLDGELAFLGASLSLEVEETRMVARIRCLAQDFTRVLGMLEDVVRAPTFPQETLDRVRASMLADLAGRDDSPGGQADRESLRAYYGLDDARARRMEAADLEAITRDDLVDFHRRHVGSRRALIAMLGSVSLEDARIELDRRFGDWAGQIADAREPLASPEALAARQIYLLDRGDVNQAEIRYLYPGVGIEHPDRPALILGSYVLGAGGFGSRMMQRIRVELGLAYGVSARWSSPTDRPGRFRAATATRSETFGVAMEEMLEVIDSFLKEGIDATEFAAARDRLLHSQIFRVDTPGEVLWRTAELERGGLPWSFHESTMEAVRVLTAEQVIAACRRHLDPEKLLIFVVGDANAFDRAASDFGPVESWSVESGEALDAGADAAAELAERVLAHHGGAEVWSSVDAVSVEADLGDQAMSILMAWPDRMSWQPVDAEEPAMILVGTRMWTGAGVELPAEEAGRGAAICQSELPILLMNLARGQLELRSPAEGVLIAIAPGGVEVRVDIGSDGVVQRIKTPTQEQLFSDYALQAGVVLPSRLEQTDQGQEPFQTELRNWQLAPAFPPDRFEPPSD